MPPTALLSRKEARAHMLAVTQEHTTQQPQELQSTKLFLRVETSSAMLTIRTRARTARIVRDRSHYGHSCSLLLCGHCKEESAQKRDVARAHSWAQPLCSSCFNLRLCTWMRMSGPYSEYMTYTAMPHGTSLSRPKQGSGRCTDTVYRCIAIRCPCPRSPPHLQ